jgi:NADPH-dependent 2,4-dienoyl-CoA reductase/sulfur reductase-like enzyme
MRDDEQPAERRNHAKAAADVNVERPRPTPARVHAPASAPLSWRGCRRGSVQKHVLILGAGFAGLELASRLSESLADEVRVTLIDRMP